MTLEEYRIWIEDLKKVPITEASRKEIEKAMRFSPERFARSKGIGEQEFSDEYRADRRILHTRLLDHEKIAKLKKRKVEELPFMYGGHRKIARVCVCIKKMQNEEQRAFRSRYKFYEGVKYNYSYADGFMGEQDVFIFDERGGKVYTTPEAFEEHFIDIREHIINQILDI
jgi:hypothetical protein